MFFQTLSYIKFIIKSTSSHGVHSPYVFNHIIPCLNLKKSAKKKVYLNYKVLRERFLNDKSVIKIKDYGSGSKYFNDNNRIVSDIAKYVSISNKKAKILFNIVEHFKPTNILEIGTSIGLSSSILALNSQSKLVSIEGCKNTLSVAKKYLSNYKNITFIQGEFNEVLPKITLNASFDLIYFDGNHTQEATLNYFNKCLNTKHNNSIFIFDDIYLNKDMQKAWNIITNNPQVRLSIDIFHYGLIFFRKEQVKQHFYLRLNS